MSFRQTLMLCETALKQTALTQCQLMILSFRWRRCGGKWGRVAALLKAQMLLWSVAIYFIEEGKEKRCCEEDDNCGMTRLCDWFGVKLVHAGFHVLGTCREHMLSWSPWADIEDEERQYFKRSVFPEVGLPLCVRLSLLTSLPWTSKCWDLHTNGRGS